MKKMFVIILPLILIFFTLAACATTQMLKKEEKVVPATTQGTTGSDKNEFRTALVASNISDPFNFWFVSEMKKSARQYATTFTLDILDSQDDSEKQNSLIEACITERYDCIIIQPKYFFDQKPYIQKAIDEGIKCMIINAYVEGARGFSTVDANPYEQGAILANAAMKDVPKYGKAMILTSHPRNGISSYQAFTDIFVMQRPDVNIVNDKICSLDMNTNINDIKNFMKIRGRFDCVLSDSDALSMAGEIAVRDNPDFMNVIFYGEGGFPGALIDIKARRYTGTCLIDPAQLAQKCIKAANDLLEGTQTEIHDNIEPIYVDKTNVSDWLQKYVVYGNFKYSVK